MTFVPFDNADKIVDEFIAMLKELLCNLVFELCWSCGDLAGFGDFNTVFERDAGDDFGEVVKAA